MLCDSGATISVVADSLVPEGTEMSLERVSISTATGEDPVMYPTALVPTCINGHTVILYAAVVPADNMPFPVILGRYIPGAKVTWSLRVETPEGEVVDLAQTTNAQDNKSSEDTFRGETNSGWMQERVKALEDSKMMEKEAEKLVRFEDDQVEAAGGETSSQVLEERPDAALLSPTGKEMWPGKASRPTPPMLATPCDHFTHTEMLPNLDIWDSENVQAVPVAAVTTRAQAKRAREQEVADQVATDSSGVVLTPPCDHSHNSDTATDCEDKDNDCGEAEKGEVRIKRQDLIEMQQQDPIGGNAAGS